MSEQEPIYNMFDYQDDILERGRIEQEHQMEIKCRMTKMAVEMYWQHINEENNKFWNWFNNERLNEED